MAGKMRSRAQTIKHFARDYFLRVNYIDIYGRNVGYDYLHILEEIRKRFPTARTSKRWLRMMAYELNRNERMPIMRRRSRKALAEGLAETLLLRRSGKSVYGDIRAAVKKKFPEQHLTVAELRRLERHLQFLKFTLPPRP